MPGKNGAGPMGMGPMTGCGAGPCGNNGARFTNSITGSGMGLRRGRGIGYGKRGCGFNWGANMPTPRWK